jgi:hypothetical protein
VECAASWSSLREGLPEDDFAGRASARPPKTEPAFDYEAEDRFFVSLFDPTGTMMTARKLREHLTLVEAKALQADVTEQGGMLLIYKEKRPPHQPDSMIPANPKAQDDES